MGSETMHPATHQQQSATGVEGTGGPGCGTRGRWRDLANNTLTTSPDRLEAAARPAGPGRASSRRAERSSQRGRRAGGQAARRPEICRGNKQQLAARTASGRPEHQRDHSHKHAHERRHRNSTTKRAGTPRFRPALNAQCRSAARNARQQRTTRLSSARPPCRPCRSSRR